MIAIPVAATIKPYSRAVAKFSSRRMPTMRSPLFHSQRALAVTEVRRPLGFRYYLRADETELKVVLSWVPKDCTTTMMATAIPAAIKPYSMAVAAFSSRKKRMMHSLIEHSHVRYAINAIPTVACRQINSTEKRWDIPHTQWFLVNGWCGWDWISLSNGGNQAEVGAFCRKRGRGWPHVPTSTNRRQRNASNSHSGLATPAPKRCCSKWRSAGSNCQSGLATKI
jgi:hypothetical protein